MRNIQLTIVPLLLAAGGCATAPAQTVQQDWISGGYSVETNRVGQTTAHFAVLPDGTADVWELRRFPDESSENFQVAKFHAVVPAEARTRFETGIGRLMAEKAPELCSDPVRHAQSTSIRWGERQSFGVYHGCTDSKSVAYAGRLTALIGEFRKSLVVEPAPYRDWAPFADES